MSLETQRNVAALVAALSLAAAVGAVLVGGPASVRADPTRMANLSIQPHTYPSGTVDSLVATLDSQERDHKLRITFYETPQGGSEVNRASGGVNLAGSGPGSARLAHPVSMYAPGSTVRATFVAYDGQGLPVWTAQYFVAP